MTKNYYAILGIEPGAGEDEIRYAYRSLAKQFHPDVNKAKNAHERFIEISEAYEFLIQKQSWKSTVEKPENNEEEYENLIRDIRERAQRQARMRYEEFKKQHEAFQKSGLNDIALFSLLVLRLVLIPVFIFLILFPIVLSLFYKWQSVFIIFFTWPFAFIIGLYIKEKWKNYLLPGAFYYTPQKLKEIFKQRNSSDQTCYYTSDKVADSKPYKIEMLKLKELKLKSEGFRQHQAQYINDKVVILVPRSHKALVVHSVSIGVKLLSILSCIIFLDISSIMWRIIFGFALGGMLSYVISVLTSTKSSTSYFYSVSFQIRIAIWILAIASVSYFTFEPFNIYTSGFIQLIVTIIIVADCFLMQFLNFLLGKYAVMPFRKQYSVVDEKLKEGYRVYNDVPVISVVFPLFKWIFG